ncbi:MAG: hypothetical protein HY290_18400 [Planctomycetia bacterium]|nr:hypothetical protein [Planctomycetia bacterium]
MPAEMRQSRRPLRESPGYLIEYPTVLPGGEWLVAIVARHDADPSLPAGSTTFPFGPSGMNTWIGWVAVEIASGRHLFLDGAEIGPVEHGDKLDYPIGWEHDSCVVYSRPTRRPAHVAGKAATDIPPQRKVMWRWTPSRGEVCSLGDAVPVESLARALAGSGYSIALPARLARSGNHQICICKDSVATQIEIEETGDFNIPVHTPDSEFFAAESADEEQPKPDRPTVTRIRRHRFTPGRDRLSLIEFKWCEITDPVDDDDECRELVIRCLGLTAASRATWTVSQAVIERQIGGDGVRRFWLIPGLSGPCQRIPFYVESKNSKSRLILTVDPGTGKLDGPHPVPEVDFVFGMDLSALCGSADGSVIGSRSREELLIRSTDPIADIHKRPVAPPDSFRPCGFSKHRALIIQDATKIWQIDYPYEGERKLIFNLSNDEVTVPAGDR